MRADTVTLAYLHAAEVAHSFSESVLHLIGFDMANHGRITQGGYISMRCGSGGLVEARNKVAATFLQDPSDWLLLVDTDMGFQPDSLERLLEVADQTERPVVGGLCFQQRETAVDGFGGYQTSARFTVMDWVEVDGVHNFAGRGWYPPNEVVRCDATGAAFLLIHRTILEQINHGTWFDRIRNEDGTEFGEDTSFCIRVGALGHPVHVHCGVKTTHLKHVWLSEQDFWGQQVAPPAVEECAVIVPVMRRPQNAEPFMQSLRASTGMATVYAVADVDDEDTVKAWDTAGAEIVEFHNRTPGTFAEKVNAGYDATDEPWLFLVGDDVRFHPGWLDHAQWAAGLSGAAVVGTNDLGNARVMNGDHATHLLIRRDYADEYGASWDGPGVVCHEGYRHWFVDDEIVTAAKQRGVWVMALGSKVEHLHPIWGKAEPDDVYELGQSYAKEDGRLFKGRLKAYG